MNANRIPGGPKPSAASVAHDAFARALDKKYGGNRHGTRLLLSELTPQPPAKRWARLNLGGK